MCHSGVGLTPEVDGELHHFSAGGLYNGLILLIDDETSTYWDHITGLAVHGPLQGRTMPTFPIGMTNVAALMQAHPDARAIESRPPLAGRVFSRISGRALRGKGFLPPGFRKTMGAADDRLDAMVPGLGVIVGDVRRFYPMHSLATPVSDEIGGAQLRVSMGELDGTPHARFADGTEPMQLMTRWYGFSYTYPGCELYVS